MSPAKIFGLLRDTGKAWSEDKAARLGASLAYYTIFSIGPLLLIVIFIASLVFSGAREQVVGQIQGLVGQEGSKPIIDAMDKAGKPSTSIPATVIGVVTLLAGASGVFGQLKDALNTIWEVKPKPGLGIMATLKDRFLTFTMVLGTGFLLLVSLVVSAGVAALSSFLARILPGGDIVGQVLSLLLSLVVVTLMFALLFKFLPDAEVAWKDVWIGAAVTAVLFTVGQFALQLYVTFAKVGSAYGAAGSLVIILVWIYYSAQILFFGAEFTQVYARQYGSKVEPSENAEFTTDEARAQQGLEPDKTDSAKDNTSISRESRKAGNKSRNRARRKVEASPWFK